MSNEIITEKYTDDKYGRLLFSLDEEGLVQYLYR